MIQVGRVHDYQLDALMPQIAEIYPWFRLEKVEPLPDPEEAYDSRRGQYHSTRILALLERKIKDLKVAKLLGVANFDLYVPGMNFVFGEARCPGRVGVISTRRLKTLSLNRPGLFDQRVVKESVHEIGHMLGLRHCADSLCVMHFSESILDTDRKNTEPCRNCRSKLEDRGVEQGIQG